jgi:uncharacterized protein (TIGR02266 family)
MIVSLCCAPDRSGRVTITPSTGRRRSRAPASKQISPYQQRLKTLPPLFRQEKPFNLHPFEETIMKFRLKKSGRYRGYQIGLNTEDETLTVENTDGKQVANLALPDFLDRLGATTAEFKREFPRLELGTHIQYYDTEGRLCEAIASSLGGGGLFIDQFSPPPMGTSVRLEINLPASPKTIEAAAKVVWIRKSLVEKIFYPGMGLKFTSIADQDRAEIIKFIEKFNRQRGFHEFDPDRTPA